MPLKKIKTDSITDDAITAVKLHDDIYLSTASFKVPSGTTAQRGTTATGAFRFNTTDTSFEGYDGSAWGAIGGAENVYAKETFTATARQTTFTLVDPYTVGNVQVYLNGVKLLIGVDVTATNGTTIVLTDPADVGDAVQTVAYGTFASSDHYLKSETYTKTEVGTIHYTKTQHLALPSNILPDTHNTRDLGSNAVRWANVYAADVHLKNERGDWSMVEEEDYLTLINNKTGKRFKLLMEELD